MSSSQHDDWSDKIDSDDGKEHNRRNKKCKTSESAEDPENIAMLSVQSRAGTSGLHASNRLKQKIKRKTSFSGDAQSEQPEVKRKRKKSNAEESELDNHLSKKFEISEVHPASGLKTSLHGVAYQLKLLMLCLKRGIDQGYQFRMTTEMDEAGKFDDLVFEYRDGKKTVYRFLQAKHKLDKDKKISIGDLLTKPDEDFDLQKYFNSYCKIKRHLKFSNENSKIKDLIICTNIGFKLGDKRGTLTLSNDIFDIKKDETILKTDLLRFKKDFDGREEIVSVLKNAPDVMQLAKDLVNRVLDNQSTKKNTRSTLLELYQFALVEEVIDCSSKKFQHKFVTDAKSLSSEAKDFRKVFEKVFKNLKTGNEMCLDFWKVIGKKKLSLPDNFGKLDGKLGSVEVFVKELVDLIKESRNNNDPYVEIMAKNFKTPENMKKLARHALIEDNDEIRFKHKFLCDDQLPGNLNEFRKQLKAQVEDLDKLRFVIKNFPKSGLPSITDIDSDIDSFLAKLLFAVNQLNEMKLSSIIDDEMGNYKGINLINTQYLADRFQKYLFDWMKDKKGRFLTYVEGTIFFDGMKKELTTLQLTGFTREFSSHMEKMNIRFTRDEIELRKFLVPENTTENTIQLFILMSIPNTILGRIQVYQILEKISDYQRHDSYIYIRLDSLLRMQGPVIDAFGSRSGNLLIIEYKSIEVRGQTSYRKLLEVVKSNDSGKIILITDNDNKLADTLRSTFSDRYVEKKIEVNGLLDLENKSRNKLIKERNVKFQGQEVPLSRLIVDEESMNLINAEALSKLINNEALEIGKPLQDLGDARDYYICRTFQRPAKIDRTFLDDELNFYVTTKKLLMNFNSQRNQDIVVISDNNKLFKELGNEKDYKKHNIHWLKSENGHFLWQESKGALSNLRNFVDPESVELFVPEKVTDIPEKVVIIAAEPGMGKSTLLTYLSVETKKFEPTLWVAKVNLSSDCSGKLDEMVKKKIRFDDERTIDFLLASAKFTSKMPEYKFFKYCYKTGKMILLFDGFDEISPYYNDKVIELFKFLKSTSVEKIWVTTRPYDIETHLENGLGSFSYVLQEFSEKDQKLFLKKYWKAGLNSDNFNDTRADVFIYRLLDSFSKLINDRDRTFISIPLQIRMIADVFKDTFQNFYNSTDENVSDLMEELGKSLKLLSLYENFFDVIFEDIYFYEKRPGFDRTTTYNKLTMAKERVNEISKHEILALQNLYPNNSMIPKEKVASLIDDIKQSENKTGIIDRVIDDRPIFVHQSFAEYFVALWFSRNWREENVKQFLIKHIFNKESIVILNFLDRMLAKDEPESSQTTESYNEYHEDVNKYKLHRAVLDNDVSEVERLLNKDKSLLDTTDEAGRTPVHLAAARGHMTIAQCFLKLVGESVYHSKTHPLCVKDELFEWTPLTYADENNHWDVAELLLQMGAAREDMLKTKRNIKKVRTLLHKATEKGYLKITDFLIEKGIIDARHKRTIILRWAALKGRLKLLNYLNHRQNTDFKTVNGDGMTPLHITTLRGNLDVVEYLIDEENVYSEAVDGEGIAALHMAASKGNLDVVKYLVKEKNANFEAVGGRGMTPLHFAASSGNLEVVKYLVDEKNANFEAINGDGMTPLHFAALMGHLETVKYLVNEKNANFKAIDVNGMAALHIAVIRGDLAVVKYLVDEKNVNFEADGGIGMTPLHIAAYKGNLEMVKYLVDEKNAKFEAVDEIKRTPLHMAALRGHLETVKYLVDEKNVNFEAIDGNGKTLLHIAAFEGNLEMVKYLVDEKNAKFEAVDGEGMTPLHLAALSGNLETVKYLVDGKNVNFEAVGGEGMTPLHSAALSSNLEVVKYLADEKNANSEAINGDGMTPLHFAALMGRLETVKHLVDEKNANFEAINGDRMTPLHFAALSGNLETVEYLVDDKNVNFEAVNGRGMTPLHFAIFSGNLKTVKYLVDEKNVNFEAVGGGGTMPLHLAASEGNLDMVKYLVDEKNANFEAINGNGMTPLHFATSSSNFNTVKYLDDETNVNFEAVGGGEMTRLDFAAMSGNLEVIKYLVDEKNANFEAINGNGMTPLHFAAFTGNLEVVKYFVDEKNANFKAVDGKRSMPLHFAAARGNLDVVKYLVDEKNANFQAVDGEGMTPLHIAASEGTLDVVKYLVDEKNANFKAIDVNGMAALHSAVSKGNLDVVKYLIDEKNANFEAVDEIKRTPLHMAALRGHLETVKYLVDKKNVDFEAIDGNGKTLLHIAAFEGNLEMVKYLVDEKNANFEAVDGKERTPLHIAAFKGNLEMVKYLVNEKNANFEAVDEKGITPLHFAAFKGKLDVVKYLVDERNANFEAVDREGKTPLHFAAPKGNLEMVRYLVDEKNANFEAVDKKGITPLHIATAMGNLEIVEYLIDEKKANSAAWPSTEKDTRPCISLL